MPVGSAVISPANARQLTEIAQWGKGTPTELAFSPDGHWLAVASTAGLTLYDARTLAEQRFIPLPDATAVTFSPDSAMLAVGIRFAGVQIRRVADGTILHTLQPAAPSEPFSIVLRFTPDGSLLAVGLETAIDIYRASDGQYERTLRGHQDPIGSIAFSADGTTLISADRGLRGSHENRSPTIKRWRLNDGAELSSFTPNDFGYDGLLAPTGEVAVTRSGARLRAWSLMADPPSPIATFASDLQLPFHLENILAFSPGGDMLLVGAEGGNLQLWRVADGTLAATLQTRQDTVKGVAFSSDSTTVAAIYQDGALRLIRMSDGATLQSIGGYLSGSPAALSPDGTILATGTTQGAHLGGHPGGRGVVRFWRLADGALAKTLPTDSGQLKALTFSPDGRILATSGADYAIQLWNTADSTLIRKIEGQHAEAVQLTFSRDGRFLAADSRNQEVQVWRITDGMLLHTLRHNSVIGSITFSADGNVVAYSDSGKVQLLNLADGSLAPPLPTGTGVYGDRLTFSPDGATLVTTYASQSRSGSVVQFWDWTKRTLIREVRIPTDVVMCATFSPDGQLLAFGGYDGSLVLVQTSNGAIVHTITDFTNRVSALFFSPDGTALASAAGDGTIHLWGLPR
jgi:WD40 repeat protein